MLILLMLFCLLQHMDSDDCIELLLGSDSDSHLSDDGVPDYPTQDEVYSDPGEDEDPRA